VVIIYEKSKIKTQLRRNVNEVISAYFERAMMGRKTLPKSET